MLPEKIKITPTIRLYIVSERKKQDISSYKLSEMCGQRKTWLPNIEIARTKTITKEALVTLVVKLQKVSEKKAIDIIEGLLEYTDYDYQYKLDEYEFELKRKEYESKLNSAHRQMVSWLERVDFNSTKSVEEYEKYLMTFTELFSTPSGINCFKRLFQYPLQSLSEEELDKIEASIQENSIHEYKVETSSIHKPCLVSKVIGDESFQ